MLTLRLQLLERDGYQCSATGYIDPQHPQSAKLPGIKAHLQGAHILRRSLAYFKPDGTAFEKQAVGFPSFLPNGTQASTLQHRAALHTFDILRNYAQLPVETIEHIDDLIDDPSNGMLLEKNAHEGFDRCQWYLQKTNVCHKCWL